VGTGSVSVNTPPAPVAATGEVDGGRAGGVGSVVQLLQLQAVAMAH